MSPDLIFSPIDRKCQKRNDELLLRIPNITTNMRH